MVLKAPHRGRVGARQGDATGDVRIDDTQKRGRRGEGSPHFKEHVWETSKEKERKTDLRSGKRD